MLAYLIAVREKKVQLAGPRGEETGVDEDKDEDTGGDIKSDRAGYSQLPRASACCARARAHSTLSLLLLYAITAYFDRRMSFTICRKMSHTK